MGGIGEAGGGGEGGSSAGPCDGAAAVTYTEVQAILTGKCATATCHGKTPPSGGLDLKAANAYADLVGVVADDCADKRKFVEPGDPTKSYLIDKLKGMNMCGPGQQMPLSPNKLPMPEIKLISDWICGGAKM